MKSCNLGLEPVAGCPSGQNYQTGLVGVGSLNSDGTFSFAEIIAAAHDGHNDLAPAHNFLTASEFGVPIETDLILPHGVRKNHNG